MSLFRSAFSISSFTLISRISGLVRELLIASIFGASSATDAFLVAFRIPNLLRRLFAEGAFSQAFVPVLANCQAKQGDQSVRNLLNHTATVLTWILTITCLIGIVGAPILVWIMASGLEQHADAMNLAVIMTRWMFPYIACMSLVALSAGVLNTYQHFALPAATPIWLNLTMILAALYLAPWFHHWGYSPIIALSIGVLLGGIAQLVHHAIALYRFGFFPHIGLRLQSLRIALSDQQTRQILRLMAPALLGVAVAQISLLINTQIASHLKAGSVSWLSYADRLMEFPTALLGVALGSVLMPAMSAALAKSAFTRYSHLLDWGLRWVFLLSMPCALALGLLAKPIIAVLYHYGAFSSHDVQETANALTGYGVGLLGLIAIKVLAPGYYAHQNIKTPVRIAVVVLVLTQCLNFILVPWFDQAGLALSISFGALLNALFLLLGLIRSKHYQPEPGWLRFILQVTCGCVVLGIFWYWSVGFFDWIHMAKGLRVLTLGGFLVTSVVIYMVTLSLSRLVWRPFFVTP